MSEPYLTEMVEVQGKPCPFCKVASVVLVPYEGWLRYQEGAFIQNAFPTLSADARELLLSGTCSECWETYMKEPEEEDEYYDPEVVETVRAFNSFWAAGGHPTVGDMLGIPKEDQ